MLARLNHDTARTTDSISHVTPIEEHSAFGNSVHIRRCHTSCIAGAKCLLAVVIRKDENDIQAGVLSHSGDQAQHSNQNGGGKKLHG